MSVNPDTHILQLEMDMHADLGPSSTGKSTIIAKTGGVAGMDVPGMPGMKIIVRMYKTLSAKKAKKFPATWDNEREGED